MIGKFEGMLTDRGIGKAIHRVLTAWPGPRPLAARSESVPDSIRPGLPTRYRALIPVRVSALRAGVPRRSRTPSPRPGEGAVSS